jgi:hypothetical protein
MHLFACKALAGTAVAAVVVGTLVAGATSASAQPTSAGPLFTHAHSHARGSSAASGASNWSGYVQQGSTYSSVSGSWTVPQVNSDASGYSSTWVGIDGYSDQYLIQTGTTANYDGGPSYSAWWEVITPSDELPEEDFNMTVEPGDSISASVTKGSGENWTMKLTDSTTGVSKSKSYSFNGPASTAEWIQEDTDVNGYVSSSPDFGTVTFTNCEANGSAASLSSDTSFPLEDTNGVVEDSISGPDSSGSGFTATYLASGSDWYPGDASSAALSARTH